VFLGIDTSCYTTSAALLDGGGALLSDQRQLLSVKKYCRGLRQAEMVFQHVKNLPVLLEKVCGGRPPILAIGVSSRPRASSSSYMPAFMSGVSLARSLAAALGVEFYTLSHQENHVEAGLWSAGVPERERLIVLHISGGATDLLLARNKGASWDILRIGGGSDLKAGQYVDRIGIALGLSFPAGPELEKLAARAADAPVLPVAVDGLTVSFSGPLTAGEKLLRQGITPEAAAASVQLVLAESFARLLKNACQSAACRDVLLVGGVSANCFIKNYLREKLAGKDITLYFPPPRFCQDNAVGCAVAARRGWRADHG
jgi:N6-L-threonylcarbamoyladenine synthase